MHTQFISLLLLYSVQTFLLSSPLPYSPSTYLMFPIPLSASFILKLHLTELSFLLSSSGSLLRQHVLPKRNILR